MEHTANLNDSKASNPKGLVGTFRTFGAHGVLYEVLGCDEDMADILVVETGERTRYPIDQLITDPVAH